jgi:predicted O-linked N-acetylglucosamine transferase (SPINDLY family)
MNDKRQPASAARQSFDAGIVVKLRQAVGLHRQGHLGDAERLYRDVLAEVPNHPDALHFLGVLEAQRGRHETAVALMDRAIEVNPRHAGALYNRANTLRDMGRADDALAGYDATLALKPGNIAALNNRGALLHGLGRYAEAVASYDRALTIEPDYADAHANRSNALLALGRAEEALLACERALAAAPDHVIALPGKGNALAKLGRPDEALDFYDRALLLAPGHPEVLSNRGNVLCQLARYEEALASFDRAILAAPNGAQAFNNRGNALMQLKRYDDAAANYARALELDPAYTEALYGRGSALLELKRHDEAIADFERLLRERPDYPYAAGMLVFAQKTCCDWRDDAAEKAMIEGVRAGKRVTTPLVVLAVSDSAADKLRCSQILMEDKLGPAQPPLWRGEKYRHDRIRVAYLSADFRAHAVAFLMAGVFEHHDRAKFETIAISHGLDDGSQVRARLMRGFDRFIDVQGKSDKDVSVIIRELETDIAVDLTGLTASGRPGIWRFRPAPVSVNYLGFAGSMGTEHIDHILADRTVIPEDHQKFYAEKLAYLPDTYMPHDRERLIAERVPSRVEQGLPEQGFVFASFNNSYKFSGPMFDVWMRLLRSVAGSVLWLPIANPGAMRNLRREAEARGVAASRLVFAPYMPAVKDHLARLRLADLFLDTLPYNAHSTAMDALWAGLPVLTCMGESFSSRVAASLLRAVGLPELIVDSLAAYEKLALSLARDSSALAAIKEKLRRNRHTSPLFDTQRFTRNLEAAYSAMWARAQRGDPPARFAVDPVSAP